MQTHQAPACFADFSKVETALAMYHAMTRIGEDQLTQWFDAKTETPVHTGAYLYRFQFGEYRMERALTWDGEQFVRPGSHQKFHVCEGDQWRGLLEHINEFA